MSKSSLRSCEECPKIRWSRQQRGIGHLASGIPDRDNDDDNDDDDGDRHERRADGVGKFNPVIL